MPRVLVVRGHLATPWELRPWTELPARYDVGYLRTASNGYDTSGVGLRAVPVGARRDRLPAGLVGDVATRLLHDRYTSGIEEALADADIVHAEELSFWFAADVARRKRRHRFKLVQTVWETLPLLTTYRSSWAVGFRSAVLAATDLYLAASERARTALLLEGVPEDKIVVCAPGIDTARFAAPAAAAAAAAGAGAGAARSAEHAILSPGRLEWQKGHHDALRAVALLHRGIVTRPDGAVAAPRLRIVGAGPEEGRLRAYADELGIGNAVTFGSVPYAEMPQVFADASCLLLGSQSSASGGFHPLDVPRLFWEEQFGMVFAEAMAAGLDIIATSNGAIPEVLDGQGTLVAGGDYVGMARALAAGPLSRPPGERVTYPAALVARYSTAAAAARLAAAYDGLVG